MKFSENDARVKGFVDRMLAGGPVSNVDAFEADPGRSAGKYQLELEVHSDAGEITVEWSAEVLPGWNVVTEWKHVDGAIRVAAIHFLPTDDNTTTADTALFKQLRLGELHRQIQMEFRRPTTLFWLWEPWVSTIAKGGIVIPRPGRRGRDLYVYAQWAKWYVEACAIAPHSPVQHLVAESHGETEGTIRAFLNRARERGLLTAAPPGKAGGELTEKALRILREGT